MRVPFAQVVPGEPKWKEYPHTPGVFVRVAGKGLTGYGTWKCVRRMEEVSATESQRHRAGEEMEWLVSNKWLTIITTPPPVFQKCSFQRALSSLERTLVEVLILDGLWER